MGKARTKRPRRVDIMVLIAALASIVVFAAGKAAELAGLHRAFQANTVRSRRVLALTTLALLVLLHPTLPPPLLQSKDFELRQLARESGRAVSALRRRGAAVPAHVLKGGQSIYVHFDVGSPSVDAALQKQAPTVDLFVSGAVLQRPSSHVREREFRRLRGLHDHRRPLHGDGRPRVRGRDPHDRRPGQAEDRLQSRSLDEQHDDPRIPPASSARRSLRSRRTRKHIQVPSTSPTRAKSFSSITQTAHGPGSTT